MDIKAPTGGEPAFKWIDTTEGMSGLLAHLKEERVNEIALDVEHHNFRSFQGLVCLVQLSTRWGDYIIDALSPEVRAFSERLNEVMADPSKVKVLHGAEHDVLWFATRSRHLSRRPLRHLPRQQCAGHAQHSLAYLLHRYVSFEATSASSWQTGDSTIAQRDALLRSQRHPHRSCTSTTACDSS
ncbi:hypothetical protein L7F22_054481 [Adiantum nelumboides]|nr:hypothetical protein [Adiantum nelumboides]